MKAQELTKAKPQFHSFFSSLDGFILGQVPSLLLYMQMHNAGSFPWKRRRERMAGELSCSAALSVYTCSKWSEAQAEEAH